MRVVTGHTKGGVLAGTKGLGAPLVSPPLYRQQTLPLPPQYLLSTPQTGPHWAKLGPAPLPSPLPVPIKVGVGPPTCPLSAVTLCSRGVPPPGAVPTMLFWHGQPDHYWSSPGDMYPLPGSGVLRYPPKSAGFGETEARRSAHPFPGGCFPAGTPPCCPT